MQNYVGKQIDRYRIIERLGMGGMAVVYKAYDTRLERDVALKLIRVDEIPESQHDRLFKRFEREAKAQARFSHRNIIPVFDYGEVDDSPYLVMAYIPGGTLKDRLNQLVDWRQAIRWLIPVAEALSYAHQRGIVHRDVKPANILFDEDNQPILTDFGIAKVLETDGATLTGTGLGVGTPEYMAPEQWQGQTSPATDQYALGVVLYEMITGRKPYSADTPAAIILMQATEPLAPPSGLVQGIPNAVEKVLYKALARDPQDRYENMDAFAKALRGLLDEAETAEPVLPEQIAQPVEPSPEAAATANSEAVTRDALDATPAEGIPQKIESGREKKGLPKWVGWALGGIVGLILITLAFNLGSKSANTPKTENTQVASVATETEVVTLAPTETTAPTMTATITLTPEPTLGIGSSMINEIDGAELAYIPEGNVIVGSGGLLTTDLEMDRYSLDNYETIHIDKFWMYKYPVTNTQYRNCIINQDCNGDLTYFPENREPALSINWYDAEKYCNYIGGELPSGEHWIRGTKRDNENQPPNLITNDGLEITSYTGIVLFDFVWEWLSDCYYDYYDFVCVQRYGDFNIPYRAKPNTNKNNVGFRCILTFN